MMFRFVFLIPSLILSTSLCASRGFAADERTPIKCINGDYGKNTELIESFEQNSSDLKNAYMEYLASHALPYEIEIESTQVHSSDSSVVACAKIENAREKGYPNFFKSFFSLLGKELTKTPPLAGVPEQKAPEPEGSQSKIIDKDCIEAAMQRKIDRPQFVCSYPKADKRNKSKNPPLQNESKSTGSSGSSKTQCVNQTLSDYVQFAVNSAIHCLSEDKPIDSRFIFKKLNNETGFDITVAWNGGTGIGQLTNAAVQELSTDEGNGKYILEQVAKSDRKSCAPFKKIAQDDLMNPPVIKKGNECAWVNPGNGLARNLLYSVGYYVHMRNTKVIPVLEKKGDKTVDNKALEGSMTLVAYSRESAKGVKKYARHFRTDEKNQVTTKEVNQKVTAIKKESPYLRETEGTMEDAMCLKKGYNPVVPKEKAACKEALSEPEMAGTKCVQKP